MAEEGGGVKEKQQIATEVMRAKWQSLRVHHRRRAVIFVSPPLELVTAAEAMASDQARVVQAWLEGGQMLRATDAMVLPIKADEELDFVIVQPFVLVGRTIEFN